jgi:hypothetical protein
MGRRGERNKNVTVSPSHRVTVSVLLGLSSSVLSAVEFFFIFP